MKQRKLLGTLAIALTLVLTACGGGGNGGSSKKATHKHEYGDWQTVTAATCTEGGTEKRVCKNSDGLCTKVEDTRSTSALGHQEPSPLVKEEEVPATCETAGSYKYTCARCGQKVQVEVPALQHDWEDAADQTGATAPTCTEEGTKIQVCKNDPTHTREVPVEALGHDFPETGVDLPIPAATETNTKGEVPYHWAKITNYSCSRGDSYRYAWSAKEVNFNYAEEGVHFTEEEIAAAQEGDAAYGKTTSDWKSEPNLLDEGDGIRFWGRPIGNAMVLSNQGRASSNNDEKIPDESVKGSRFEFDFVFDTDVNDVCLSADLDPAQYTNDIFKNRSGDQEWTPGYRFVDDDNDPSTPNVAEQITGMRFIILLDGKEVPLDESVNTAPAGRKWYQFPCKLNLTAGKHNLNIAMAGGYLHTFYSFSFEKVPPAHQHNFATETDVAAKGEGYVGYKTATCAKEGAQRINIRALDGSFVGTSANKTGNGAPLAGYLKLGTNNDSIAYKFDWAGEAKTAKLYQYGYMDNFSSNGNRTYTSQQKNNLGPSGCNFGVKFNNTEVQISDATKAITYSDFFSGATVSPGGSGNSNLAACIIGEVSLVNGDNTFTFTRYDSFNLSISNFYLVIEA